MEIIEAKLEHIDLIYPLFNEYMIFYKKPSDELKYKSYLKDRIENEEATIFLALNDENEPMGFVLNYYSFSSVSLGKIIVLNDLFVHSDHRKKGVAEQLINSSFDLAKNRGAIRVDLGTAKDNKIAQNLYKKIGFSKDEEFYAYSYMI